MITFEKKYKIARLEDTTMKQTKLIVNCWIEKEYFENKLISFSPNQKRPKLATSHGGDAPY